MRSNLQYDFRCVCLHVLAHTYSIPIRVGIMMLCYLICQAIRVAYERSSVVEHFPRKCKVLDLMPSIKGKSIHAYIHTHSLNNYVIYLHKDIYFK